MKKIYFSLFLLIFNPLYFLFCTTVFAQNKLSDNWYLLYKAKYSENYRQDVYQDPKNYRQDVYKDPKDGKYYSRSFGWEGHNLSGGGRVNNAKGGINDIQKSGPYNSKKECESAISDLSKKYIFVGCIKDN